ncbi:10972_t:CDS:2, partial [Entrophospora sp. SA101]
VYISEKDVLPGLEKVKKKHFNQRLMEEIADVIELGRIQIEDVNR